LLGGGEAVSDLIQLYANANIRIGELEAENAALRADKARLDYIFWPSGSKRARAQMQKFIGTKPYLPPNGLCPWRAGIDAAMEESKQ